MAKINGGIIGPNNPTGPFSAGGVWRLEDAFNAQKAGEWPVVLGYQVPNSLRFNPGSSDYLSRTPSSSANTNTYTFSTWVKKWVNSNLIAAYQSLLSANDGSNNSINIGFGNGAFTNSGDYFEITYVDSAYAVQWSVRSNALYRDVSAWYHVVVAVDTTQATASDRVKLYVNGEAIATTATSSPAQNTGYVINTNVAHNIGRYVRNGDSYLYGYLAETYMIGGSQLTPSSFGETDATTGIWIPKAYTGSFGTNGFYLNFANSGDLGNDVSGNNNDWTVNGLTSIDQSYDSPTNNFATLNPLVNYQAYPPVLAEGNLKNTSNANASNGGTSPSTIVVSQGKWYAEMKVGANKQDGTALGIVTDSYRFDYQNDAAFYTSASFSSVAYLGDGRKVISNTFSSYGATFTTNDIIGIAVDLDNDTVTFYKNGVSQGVISTTLTGGYFICCYGYNSSVQEMNFGYPPFTISSGNADANGFGNFEYAVPSGYYSLCTKNLALYG